MDTKPASTDLITKLSATQPMSSNLTQHSASYPHVWQFIKEYSRSKNAPTR